VSDLRTGTLSKPPEAALDILRTVLMY